MLYFLCQITRQTTNPPIPSRSRLRSCHALVSLSLARFVAWSPSCAVLFFVSLLRLRPRPPSSAHRVFSSSTFFSFPFPPSSPFFFLARLQDNLGGSDCDGDAASLSRCWFSITLLRPHFPPRLVIRLTGANFFCPLTQTCP